MRQWTGEDEYGSYIFHVDERISSVDNTLKYDLDAYQDGRKVDTLWFNSLPSLRTYLRREYGKITLKLKSPNEM